MTPRELELAGLLVESLAAPFEPGKYKDTYRQNLRALLDAKIRGEELPRAPSAPMPTPVPDIREGLKASLARAQKPAARTGRPLPQIPTAVARGK